MAKKSSISKAVILTEATKVVQESKDLLVRQLLADVGAVVETEKHGTNVELRKAAHRKALAANSKIEAQRVSAAQDELLAMGAKIAQNSESMMAEGLTEDDAVDVMTAYLDGKIVAESQSAIADLVKTLVFRHFDLVAAELGEEFPEHVSMVMDVPSTGKRFCREGAGRKEAEFDLNKLAELVGPEMFERVTRVTAREIDEAALSAAIVADPQLMETIRDAVVPGGYRSPRLMVRDIPANEKE